MITLYAIWIAVLLRVFIVSTLSAKGQAASPVGSADTSFCIFTKDAAKDEYQTLSKPRLVASVAKLNFVPGEAAAAGVSTIRESVGLSYSLEDLFRGNAIKTRAHAECEAYKARSILLEFLDVGDDGFERSAVAAKLVALEAAIPESEAIFSRTRRNLATFRTTSVHVDAISIHVDRLRTDIEQCRAVLALPMKSTRPLQFSLLRDAIKREQVQDAIYQRSLAEIQRTTSWRLTAGGGYEHLTNIRHASPYYWTVSFDTSLGMFFRHHAANNAVAAHTAFLQQDPAGPAHRSEALMVKLQTQLTAAKQRLADNTVLLSEMTERVNALKQISDLRATEYSDDVWFQMITTSAEHEYLRARIDTLKYVVGDAGTVKQEQP